ncbi:MAG: cobalamin-dependent protein [Treponema sp.]|nr:cobalamin-dependent protein [Treponema sp.]
MADILLITINAKWIHPSLALRLLKANLGKLEEQCQIAEFALRQNLDEKTGPVLAARPKILGISVSIWNHAATLELLKELWKAWGNERPVIVLGGPEVSFLPPDEEIFKYADYCIRGEGEISIS